jgi:histone deacetylase complex regulatory component SIN3
MEVLRGPMAGFGGARLKSSALFNEFLKCLNLFAQDIISRHELIYMMSDVLTRYPELTVGFPAFVRLKNSRPTVHMLCQSVVSQT